MPFNILERSYILCSVTDFSLKYILNFVAFYYRNNCNFSDWLSPFVDYVFRKDFKGKQIVHIILFIHLKQ